MKIAGTIITLAACFLLGTVHAAEEKWREDFTKTIIKDGLAIPENWVHGGFKFGIPDTLFYVKEDEELKKPVLVIDSKKSTGTLMCRPSDRNVSLHKTPILRWRWRVKSLPPGGDGRGTKVDDQPVAIYVGGNGWLSKRSMAYRWENETPVDTQETLHYGMGALKVNWICIRNKESELNVWYEERRNLAKDFMKYYEFIPDEFVITICGNSQYSQSETIAEIEFLELIPDDSTDDSKSASFVPASPNSPAKATKK